MGGLARRFEIAKWNRFEPARFALLVRLARLLVPAYRFKFPQLDWWRDDVFTAYLIRFGELDGQNTDRRWMVHQLLRLVADVPGDTAECGVYQGAGSFLILKANAVAGQNRHHYMFDSFEGLSNPGAEDGTYWREGDLAASDAALGRRLSDCVEYSVMKGWIPKRFAEVAERRFAFVHIDVDLYQPTRDSLDFFYPRMSEGGIVVVDDYGFSTCPGATRAADEVLTGKTEQMIALPDGGGFLIKGRRTTAAAALQ